jgi:hypothetical protein
VIDDSKIALHQVAILLEFAGNALRLAQSTMDQPEIPLAIRLVGRATSRLRMQLEGGNGADHEDQ